MRPALAETKFAETESVKTVLPSGRRCGLRLARGAGAVCPILQSSLLAIQLFAQIDQMLADGVVLVLQLADLFERVNYR